MKRGRFFLFSLLLLVIGVALARPASANLVSQILRFFGREEVNNREEVSLPAAISFPLLGSNASLPAGVGGPVDNGGPSLLASQESALIAPRNPLGTLPPPTQDQIVVYTVQPGDTPSSIADRFGISLNTLLWANNIPNANLVKTGDELVILPVSGVKYEVKKGDTVGSIAKKFKPRNVRTEEELASFRGDIMSFNGLAIGEVIEPGAVIIIPDGEIVLPSYPSGVSSRFASLPELKGYFLRPVIGGRRSRGIHGFNGIDLANSCGLPVLAAAGGTVILARPQGWNGGYGRYVAISHPNGTQTLYAHLAQVLVEAGQVLTQGATIGSIGSTGNSTGCHIHFEVRGAKNPF